jgi:histidinol dehydrogenase
VDKVLGPGNQFVTAAKMVLQNSEAMVAIDMPAGPSEVLVIADRAAPVPFVAADLLSQAEHGPDSQVRLGSHLRFPLLLKRKNITIATLNIELVL